jgi:transglutaminase-like putative cysteine protease
MRKVWAFAVIAVVALASLAIAQQAASRRPTLHEDLPPDTDPTTSPMIGDTGGGGAPAAFAAGDKVLPKPTLDHPDKAQQKGEPVLGGGGFEADRKTSMTPDGNTGPDSTLHYNSVFNPDVLPFKRMSAFDGIADNYSLKIDRTALVEVPVVGSSNDPSRDRFWGSVLVQLSPNKDVPLPSVAPDMRILSYEIKPRVALKFEKDGADNFYVRSDESSASGTYRLVFLADADAGYFAPSLPKARYTPLTLGVPPDLRPRVPAEIRKEAQRTLDKLGIDETMELGRVFNTMVAYFRAFEPKQITASSGNIYRDLCDTQAGVCRHRAFAFMITANALGIPTRFVENEAHAFVEVWFPERRWQRVDLGGAALRMEVTGADDKTLHRPRAEDPFAKPPEYKQNYTQLEGDIKGLTQQQIADKRRPLDQAPASGQFGAHGGGSGGGSGSGGLADATDPARITPDPNLPTVRQDPAKPTPLLDVTLVDPTAYRGDTIHIEGRVHVGQQSLANHPVDVYIAPSGKHGASSLPLGRVVTAADGTFRQDFAVPAQLDLKTYEIYLSTPEDAKYNAALSED